MDDEAQRCADALGKGTHAGRDHRVGYSRVAWVFASYEVDCIAKAVRRRIERQPSHADSGGLADTRARATN